MKTSSEGLAIIKEAESFRASPYLCPAGIPTIGYGCTRHPDGRAVTLDDPPLSQEEAETYLAASVAQAEQVLRAYVTAPLTQHQFDALISFIYNLGAAHFAGSSLLRLLNAGQYDRVPTELRRWTMSKGKHLPGLVRRREAEVRLWQTGAP